MNVQDFIIRVLEFLEESIDRAMENIAEKDHSLNAQFERETKLLSASYKGFSVTGKKHLSINDSQNNMMIISPSGGGKTTTVVYPSCFNIGSSMIINDPSGEIYKTKNYFLKRGFRVCALDFTMPENSIYYNPMHRIQSNADINKIAQILVRATTKDNKDFWSNKAVELISMFMHFLLDNAPKESQNLTNVFYLLELLQGESGTIDALFADKASPKLWQKYKSLIGNSENTRASIISSAQASLSFIADDEVLSKLTSTDTFDFSSLRTEKTVLFLRCPLGDMTYYSTILSIFFEQFFSEIFQKLPNNNDDYIFVIIDELSSLFLPNLANIISNARKFKIPILGVLQSENQLYNNYGEYNAKTILNNCATKVYFTGLTDECNRLEKILGQYTYEDKETGGKRIRSLKTADEIRTMPKDRVLIIPSGMRPIYAKTTPYYKQKRLVKFLELEPPNDSPDEEIVKQHEIKYLDIEQYRNV